MGNLERRVTVLKTWPDLGFCCYPQGSRARNLLPKLEKSFITSLPCPGMRPDSKTQEYPINCEWIWGQFPFLPKRILLRFPKFVFAVNRWSVHTRVALVDCVWGGVWCWVSALCVSLPRSEKTSWLTTQDRYAQSQGVISGSFWTC